MTGSVSKSETEGSAETSLPSPRALTLRAILLGALIGALLAVLAGEVASRTVWDSWQRQFPRDISTENVAVVLIDDDSVNATFRDG